jgi:hypothetical protein
MEQKVKQQDSASSNPFVDPGELQRFVAASERDVHAALARESQER